ncbi:hypothetical protein RHGRI_023053 [Rhododendron griersonianum]|uniref:ARM repeat superfamily protein n=1 Tax=Rhododendron griersonianum TaxID=479676 RepID=A0AAV6J6J8_9ERIC|nr:hypothetical protein RHGRI_023053 [Rhododendron griersonianum]
MAPKILLFYVPHPSPHLTGQSSWLQGEIVNGLTPPKRKKWPVFCLKLLIGITLNNRDRFTLLWQGVYDHIDNLVHSTLVPCSLAEKAVFGLLRICQRLLPHKETLTDELLKSLQLILKLDTRVADAYREHITQEVMHLVKGNVTQIISHEGWRTIYFLALCHRPTSQSIC